MSGAHPYCDEDGLCDLQLTYALALVYTSPAFRKEMLRRSLRGNRPDRAVRCMVRDGELLGVVAYSGPEAGDLVITLPNPRLLGA